MCLSSKTQTLLLLSRILLSTTICTNGQKMMMSGTVQQRTTAYIWMLWLLAWAAVVCKSLFKQRNIREGRTLYDQLSPLGPIMLALTAATPIYKGFLVDTDVRWNQISRAVDDRTPEELGEKPLEHARWRIPKSRYASNSTYIAEDPRLPTRIPGPQPGLRSEAQTETPRWRHGRPTGNTLRPPFHPRSHRYLQ